MGLLGYTIVQIQRMEGSLSSCYTIFAKKDDLDEDYYIINDLDELLNKANRQMLGKLLIEIKKSGQFKRDFIKRFERFIKKRNRLIHYIFKEKQYYTLNNYRSLVRLHRLISSTFQDAAYFEQVFDAYAAITWQFLSTLENVEMKDIEILNRIVDTKRNSGDLDVMRKAINFKKNK